MGGTFDVERARRETRGCEQGIHFNNAGASLMPAPVADSLHAYLKEEEESGGYETMDRRACALDNFYAAAARLLNCTADEIAFTDSATRAWNTVFYAFDFKPGDQVLAGSAEYGSNLVAMLHRVKRTGAEIVRVPDDPHGQIDVAALERLVTPRVRLICLTHIPSGGGLINPAAAVGRVATAAGIPFLLDACQSIGQLPLDVEALGCDILCGTGRKYLRGPRGTGLLYVRKGLIDQLEPNQLNHHAAELLSDTDYRLRRDAKRFECWERHCAGQVALGVAIDYALGWGIAGIETRISTLATELRRRLADINGLTVADQGHEKCGIVTFFSDRKLAAELQGRLRERMIKTSIVPFSANPVSTTQRHLPEMIRASLHYYNTFEEIDRFVENLQQKLLQDG
ncbi:MAG: aminotransferase [Desulfuromonas sp.]|nr:MAG: aminotransferase [Desulfuromonas sp.]